MTAVDREWALGFITTARDKQETRAALFTEKQVSNLTLQAENRSYTVALLIDAIENGLLEHLHAEAEQQLFIDVAVDQDRAWAAYMAGMASPPESTAPMAIAVHDEQPAGPGRTAHYGGMPCPGCPECIGYTDPDEPDEEDEDDAPEAATPDLITAMGRHSSTHGTGAVYDPADPHDAALAAQARAEYVDYAEAEAVREINELMELDAAGVDSWEDL